jgi:type III secretory pathway component EscR
MAAFCSDETREDLDRELHRAVSITLPAHDATRTSSIDLLAATIETSLIKLSLTRNRVERALYNHQPQTNITLDEDVNIAKAIEAAYLSLKKDEKEMKMQSQSLDRQLQEYESLMQLVDGGKNGYQQIINDWTKVQQETDECLKDLRRLGWTGD